MTSTMPARRADRSAAPDRIALVDLLDRVLAKGIVVSGDLTISIADVDLVHISLHALISSVRAGKPGPVPTGQAETGADWRAGGRP